MTDGVVYDLEAVQVDEQQRKAALEAARLCERLLQPLVEHAAVEEAGQRCVARHEAQVLLRGLARHELPYLAAHDLCRLHEIRIRRPGRAAEELDHAVELAAEQDGERG